ncbi:YlbL family protein [Thermosediminibacter oceani]|uniref:endopeptidase La n=1 Tax=Thermosediminibacter oceani (strain ATCC BAA-1034 / DSM 16646 / JW/IW-1228P) TaxID=555079 RepID=D9S330_THEOJ|nr:PDZ domain-containing protein [Thermosediminibacter oceani]ADL07807.1 PDZ/DHR/GLGF domain protein [Thermosediminibacter oceani DSM 16646]
MTKNSFLKRRSILVVTLIVLLAVNFYVANHYTIVAPGVTLNLKEIVRVENGIDDEKGVFFLTTVSTRPSNIPLLIYSALHPHVSVEKKERLVPPGMDMKKYREYMTQWMEESQKIAEVVALRRAGYKPLIMGKGARVVEVMENSPARGIIMPDDIITKVDGIKVNLAEEVVNIVTRHQVGDAVDIEIERNGKRIPLKVTTVESKTQKGKPMIGVLITTLDWKPVLPVKIDINTGDIGGPSAGLMFTLEILNQLTPGDLTKGRKIAGTGTISLDEQVGEIGGVAQKVAAAYRDGAEIFFVPEENARDAFLAARKLDIEIVPVKTLKDALDYLEKL